jgi:hypothetical protein
MKAPELFEQRHTSDIYQNSDTDGDETLPIINKSKHPKRENIKNKMEGPTSKKTKKNT